VAATWDEKSGAEAGGGFGFGGFLIAIFGCGGGFEGT